MIREVYDVPGMYLSDGPRTFVSFHPSATAVPQTLSHSLRPFVSLAHLFLLQHRLQLFLRSPGPGLRPLLLPPPPPPPPPPLPPPPVLPAVVPVSILKKSVAAGSVLRPLLLCLNEGVASNLATLRTGNKMNEQCCCKMLRAPLRVSSRRRRSASTHLTEQRCFAPFSQ